MADLEFWIDLKLTTDAKVSWHETTACSRIMRNTSCSSSMLFKHNFYAFASHSCPRHYVSWLFTRPFVSSVVNTISWKLLDGFSTSLQQWCILGQRRTIRLFWGQRTRVQGHFWRRGIRKAYSTSRVKFRVSRSVLAIRDMVNTGHANSECYRWHAYQQQPNMTLFDQDIRLCEPPLLPKHTCIQRLVHKK